MLKVRAAAVIVGALIIGVLSWAMPAQATDKRPSVAYADTCDGVKATFTNPLRVDIAVKVTGHEGEVKVGKDSAVEVTLPKGDAQIQASVQVGQVWLKLGDPHTWTSPKYCPLPAVVTATTPTCESPQLVVTVANPNRRQGMLVRFGRGRLHRLKPGAQVQHTATADVTVWVNGKQFQVVAYMPPKDCPTPTPEPTPSATATPTPEPTGSSAPEPTGTAVPPPDAKTPQLPVTGATLPVLLGTGGALGMAGLGLLWAFRRRRATFIA